jgi:hypothetical protein
MLFTPFPSRADDKSVPIGHGIDTDAAALNGGGEGDEGSMSRRAVAYFDGVALMRVSEAHSDPSLNWMDLARVADNLRPGVTRCVYFCPPQSCDRAAAVASAIYVDALGAAGVECLPSASDEDFVECRRCGHGWHEPAAAGNELDIAATILDHAWNDVFDDAILFVTERARSGIARLFGHRLPEKRLYAIDVEGLGDTRWHDRLDRLEVSGQALRQSLFGPFVSSPSGVAIARPQCWAARWSRPRAMAGGRK